jgi:hypothetical protein
MKIGHKELALVLRRSVYDYDRAQCAVIRFAAEAPGEELPGASSSDGHRAHVLPLTAFSPRELTEPVVVPARVLEFAVALGGATVTVEPTGRERVRVTTTDQTLGRAVEINAFVADPAPIVRLIPADDRPPARIAVKKARARLQGVKGCVEVLEAGGELVIGVDDVPSVPDSVGLDPHYLCDALALCRDAGDEAAYLELASDLDVVAVRSAGGVLRALLMPVRIR